MHVRDQRAFSRIEQVKDILKSVTALYLETDLSVMQESFVQQVFVLEDNQRISDFFRPHIYSKYKHIIKKSFDVDISMYDAMHPMVLNNAILTSILNPDQDVALDHYIWKMANDMELRCGGIETAAEQMAVVKSLKISAQIKSIKDIARSPQAFRKKLYKLMGYYQAEDIHNLYQSSKKGMGSAKKLMLKERNFRMAARIDNLAAQRTCLFAIGAGHLSGNNGVLSLLKSKGLTVHPVYVSESIQTD